jgi:magnesium transporter
MANHKKRQKPKRKTPGTAPGSLIFTGEKKSEIVTMQLSEYNTEFLNITTPELNSLKPSDGTFTQWLDIRGLHDIEHIKEIGNIYELHQLALEDILNVHQRPKFDEFDTGILIVLKALSLDENRHLEYQQVSLFFNDNRLICFQELEDDLFFSIRERLNKPNSRIREKGIPYLVYALIDLVVDQYVELADQLNEQMDVLEDRVINDFNQELKVDILHIKNLLTHFRRASSPLREVLNKMSTYILDGENKLVHIYIRDLYDHLTQLLETLEDERERIAGINELYDSQIQHINNNIIKTLTIMSTIFIPITFVAGVYGMNFRIIPELDWRYGYLFAWVVMIAMIVGMIIYFKNKKWF